MNSLNSAEIWTWLIFCITVSFSPGPANFIFMATSSRYGFVKSLPIIAGVYVVFTIEFILVGLGLGEVLGRFPVLAKVIQILGVLYLFYLAWSFIRSSKRYSEKEKIPSESIKIPNFRDGVLIQILNPKGWTILSLQFSLFPFLISDGFFGTPFLSILFWGMIFIPINLMNAFFWTGLGAWTTRLFSSPKARKIQGFVLGGLLFLLGVWILFQ